jgi:hypothetical protein
VLYINSLSYSSTHTHTDNIHLHLPGGTPREGSCKCVASLNASNSLPFSYYTLTHFHIPPHTHTQTTSTSTSQEVLPEKEEKEKEKGPVSVWPVWMHQTHSHLYAVDFRFYTTWWKCRSTSEEGSTGCLMQGLKIRNEEQKLKKVGLILLHGSFLWVKHLTSYFNFNSNG